MTDGARQSVCAAALGDEAVYINSNPEDDRITDICREDSRQEPLTLAQ